MAYEKLEKGDIFEKETEEGIEYRKIIEITKEKNSIKIKSEKVTQ